MRIVVVPLLRLGGYTLGNVLAAIVSFLVLRPTLSGSGLFDVLMLAITFGAFGLVPLVMFGAPAMWALQRWRIASVYREIALTFGGGAVGGALMFLTFDGRREFGILSQMGLIAVAGMGFGLAVGALAERAWANR